MSAINRGSERIPQDFYATPKWCVDLIFPTIDLSRVYSSLEPCLGSGVIYKKLPRKRYWAEIRRDRDYLKTSFPKVDLIVTNPPFSLALKFLRKSLSESNLCVYLLRLNFLGSQDRKLFWSRNSPTHLYVLSRRPSFAGKGTDATEYAWFCWDRGNLMVDPPGIYVL